MALSSQPAHRLLYRGALSLPDSHLLLDGLSFTADIADGADLLNNPLALALESMRGRPSLHYLGTTPLNSVYLDTTGSVGVDVHPRSTLTRITFENILCLTPITCAEKRTDYGIRVSLSDNRDLDTTDVLIYGQLQTADGHLDEPLPSTSTAAPTILQLFAARILPNPPTTLRLPRPDDPTPRKPPVAFGTKRKRHPSASTLELGDTTKRGKLMNGKGKVIALENDAEALERARDVMLHMPKPGLAGGLGKSAKVLGREARIGKKNDVFKVPVLPSRLTPLPSDLRTSATSKKDSKSDAKSYDPSAISPEDIEKANKIAVKRATVRCLSGYGISKDHEEFNDLFQMIYHGTSFALRNCMRIDTVDTRSIDVFVAAHAKLYIERNEDFGASTAG